MPDEQLDDVLGQLNRGELEVAEALFRAYTPYLRAIVRRQLSDRLRSQFDSADVVQSVWVQVVKHLGQEGWPVGTEEQLRGLLATIAKRRLYNRVRKDDTGPDVQEKAFEEWDAAGPQRFARASEVAQADETWTRMLALCPPEHQQILHLRREGLLLDEIAARTGLHEGSVRRILRRLARELAMKQEPLTADAEMVE
ncbi:RNA polymerase sigma factor [Limnoglobus roseus]|uniref:RNA polymerase subunit sigma-24 n=1 Tax=Limnoglobus roseus TaxID=2598579 RepID=A0A5C1AP53_9BACT|nr:sigma-70 family RNA polymerase sigma factor [Limnoglobus roseus]QEL20365.1 RNA polymerase subunit sigma-24 [Limnoglobus roseus]